MDDWDWPLLFVIVLHFCMFWAMARKQNKFVEMLIEQHQRTSDLSSKVRELRRMIPPKEAS